MNADGRIEPPGSPSMESWNTDKRPSYLEYLKRIRPGLNEAIGSYVFPFFEGRGIERGFEGIVTGGKRLRGGLTLAAFELMSRARSKRAVALDLAVAVELAHTVSLIHDDIIDEDTERRGAASLHMTMGRKRALLEGLGLLSIPYTVASRHGTDFVHDLSEVHMRMVRGALIEFGTEKKRSLDEYQRIVELKTGSLFGLAAKFGAKAAGAEPSIVDGLQSFGVLIGTIYQILDDLSDLHAARESRKALGQGSEAVLLRYLNGDPIAKTPHQMSVDEWKSMIGNFDQVLMRTTRRAYEIADGLAREYPRKFAESPRSSGGAPSLRSIILGISEIAKAG
ncbi:MAG TPA: polyprenyl synthetase family protein [Methanomassiliicoccales archaeon]|nr:polyprenyl synthetase family protein [Methanomassiliicoccales archaeon]